MKMVEQNESVREGSPVGASRQRRKRFVERWVLSLEWNSECVMEGESGEQVEIAKRKHLYDFNTHVSHVPCNF